MRITVFGIPNCGSVKKGRDWLDAQALPYEFHDFKKQGLSAAQLEAWLQHTDWQTLLNTRGTTWRKLSEAERANPDEARAKALMLAQPSLVKRPVVVSDQGLLVGFDAEKWQKVLAK